MGGHRRRTPLAPTPRPCRAEVVAATGIYAGRDREGQCRVVARERTPPCGWPRRGVVRRWHRRRFRTSRPRGARGTADAASAERGERTSDSVGWLRRVGGWRHRAVRGDVRARGVGRRQADGGSRTHRWMGTATLQGSPRPRRGCGGVRPGRSGLGAAGALGDIAPAGWAWDPARLDGSSAAGLPRCLNQGCAAQPTDHAPAGEAVAAPVGVGP